MFEDIVKVLGACMMTKYVVYMSPFWISSVEAFTQIVKIGIPALNESGKNDLCMWEIYLF